MAIDDFTRAKEKILANGELLSSLVESEAAAEVHAAMRDLRENRFDVAVVGVIKAGKSSFLNALTRHPDLLPCDVNPWTAAITRLHFGHPGGQTDKGQFHFLSPGEWDGLTLQGGRAGADARRRGENLDPNLKSQLDDLLTRVRRRFGPGLDALLGTTHEHPNMTREILNEYVASGEGRDDRTGWYADILREAEVFLPQEPFPEAVTYVDTPGTNDPFRMREERTLKYVGSAHAFLLILNAGMGLPRDVMDFLGNLVNVLRKERLVVFVNRIDQLGEVPKDLDKVLDFVRKSLQRRFPDMSIPVIGGSAHWAGRALERSAKSAKDLVRRGCLLDLALGRGHVTEAQAHEYDSNFDAHVDSICDLAWRLSGLDDVQEAIEDRLLSERGRHLLVSSRDRLGVIAKREEGALRGQAAVHDQNAEQNREGKAKVEESLRLLAEHLEELSLSEVELEARLSECSADLHDFVDEQSVSIGDRLRSCVQKRARLEGDRLVKEGISIFGDSAWKADVDALRVAVRQSFDSAFSRGHEDLVKLVERSRRNITGPLRRADGQDALGSLQQLLSGMVTFEADASPSLEGLGKSLNIDLGNWLERWFSGRGTAQEKAAALKELIVKEFDPVVDRLTASAREAYGRVANAATSAFGRAVNTAVVRVRAGLEEQRRRHDETLRDAEHGPSAFEQRAEREAAEATGKRLKADRVAERELEIRSIEIPGATGAGDSRCLP